MANETEITEAKASEAEADENTAHAPESEEYGNAGTEGSENKNEPDYEQLINEDINALREEFPELSDMESITELEDPVRYGALRDLGLTPQEAYLATTKNRRKVNTKEHLHSAVPKFASTARGVMSDSELRAARELFEGLGDREIKNLYKKVTS